MELIPNSRTINIINNIDSSIVDRIEFTNDFYINLNIFLEKYKGSNEDYAKLICNDKIINTINIFNVNHDFIMPNDTDIIYMIKSYKKYFYIIMNKNGSYKLINNKKLYYDKYYSILSFRPIIPTIISYNDVIHYNRKELLTLFIHNVNNYNYNTFIFQCICEMIHPHEYDDYDFMLNIFSHCVNIHDMYLYISDRLKNDKKFILNIILINPYILKHVNSEMKNNYDIVLAAVTCNIGYGEILLFASDKLKDNYDIVLAAVNHSGGELQYASDKLKDNYNIVLAAVNNNGNALLFASNNLRNNYDIVLAAVNNCDHALEFASYNMRDNYDIVLAAVKHSGKELYYVSDRLKDNYDIVLAAVNQCGRKLYHASVRLKDNYDIVLAACNTNPIAIQYASDRLKEILDI